MNKIIIAILVLGVAGIAIYFLFGRGDRLPEGFQGDITAEEVEQALQDENPRTVHGSCNAIATASNCIDYVGSMWGDNNMAELNCEGAGTFSKNTCPYPEFGGCQIAGGTVMETIAWVYKEGPGEYTEESVPYARGACDANPVSNWVMPDDFLN